MVQPPIGSHHQGAMTPQQHQQQAQAAAHAIEQAKRRSSKPTDKTMPDGVENVVIGDGVQRYRELRDLERRLDATMTRKRLDVVDSVTRNPKRYRTLRIWISNTVEDQAWQGNGLNVDSFDFSSTVEATYRVKIEGRLLGEDDEEKSEDEIVKKDDAGEGQMDTDAKPKAAKPASAKPGQRYRFSHFFKSLSVEFSDRSRARNGAEQSIEWKKPDRTPAASNLPAAADFDELTFKRSGDENTNVIINLQRHEEPDRFALSPPLAEIVDMQEGTRPEIVQGLYEYIKLMGLQEDEEKRNFRCDELLRPVCNRPFAQL
jgi:SWI/SNF-related matrix-associated actin-dependent regulator of chromatin subfamily D